jgi:hypothetical protein
MRTVFLVSPIRFRIGIGLAVSSSSAMADMSQDGLRSQPVRSPKSENPRGKFPLFMAMSALVLNFLISAQESDHEHRLHTSG